jgi:phenylacetate-CoA ligase
MKDSTNQIIKHIQEKKEGFWLKEREKRALILFHKASSHVPAYKDFLKKNKIRPSKIKTFKDFQSIPPVNKENYLRKYPMEKLSWNGHLKKPLVFTSTSGSTGEPFYFLRNHDISWQSSIIHELFLKNSSVNKISPTLVIVCFGMGVWIGGTITFQAFEMAGRRGHPVSIITPGINKEETFKALKSLAPHFEQTMLAGYPPFLKDIIDEAPGRGIRLKNLNISLLFAAEPFTEKFRDYLARKINIGNIHLNTMNIYGSADIGTMAFETPFSILIRRIALKKPKLFKNIFSSANKTPTLAQYIPSFILFESPENEILLTGDNSVPLIRYSIGDHGGTFTFNQIKEMSSSHGVDLHEEVNAAGLTNHLYQLPFVYVYERIDMSTTLYGLQLYPETIKEVLLKNPFNKFSTGKFTLITKFDTNQDQYLEINLELQKNKKGTNVLKFQLLNEIVKNLRLKNSEYRELSDFLEKRSLPKLVFWSFEDPLYFKPGVKQKWAAR